MKFESEHHRSSYMNNHLVAKKKIVGCPRNSNWFVLVLVHRCVRQHSGHTAEEEDEGLTNQSWNARLRVFLNLWKIE